MTILFSSNFHVFPNKLFYTPVLHAVFYDIAFSQARTEALILEHSGEYVSLLIAKKLERPRKSRHILDRPCLCQYIEQRVCRLQTGLL